MPFEDEFSREVTSNQSGIHENLEQIVRKHFISEFKKPIAEHTQVAFDSIRCDVENALNKGTSLYFDSFCGTGMSTTILANENPNALVVGIDRSIARLSKKYNESIPENVILLQADCIDFWLLAVKANWKLDRHTIYYPNPYPKSKHVKRRCHAHPSYPLLFELGGQIELRTNWKIYADEFAQSFAYASDYLKEAEFKCSGLVSLVFDKRNAKYMTLFEKKYVEDGQEIYSCKYY